MKFKIIIGCALVLFLVDCTKHKTETPPDVGADYYPGKVGSYIIYDVDSIDYSKLQQDTTYYKFQIKEKITEVYSDNQNRPTLRIERYRKNYSASIPYSQMTWTIQDVWSANASKTKVEVVEENVRYTKLIFPVKKGSTWNGNAGNTLLEWDYKYDSVDESYTIGGLTFNKTANVKQKDFLSAINKQYYYERYARGVGLIYRIIEDYDYQDGLGNTNPGHIYGGTFYEMRINSYGME